MSEDAIRGAATGALILAICETFATVRTVLLDSPPSVLSCINAWLYAGFVYTGLVLYYTRNTP